MCHATVIVLFRCAPRSTSNLHTYAHAHAHTSHLVLPLPTLQYVRPLFRELLRTSAGRPIAVETFAAFSKSYHPVCAKMDIEKETAKAPVDPDTLARTPEAPAAVSGLEGVVCSM